MVGGSSAEVHAPESAAGAADAGRLGFSPEARALPRELLEPIWSGGEGARLEGRRGTGWDRLLLARLTPPAVPSGERGASSLELALLRRAVGGGEAAAAVGGGN